MRWCCSSAARDYRWSRRKAPSATDKPPHRKTPGHVLCQKNFLIRVLFFCHFEMLVTMYRPLRKVKCILEQLCLVAQIRPYWWAPCNTETPPCTKGLEVLTSLCSAHYHEVGWTTDALSYNSGLAAKGSIYAIIQRPNSTCHLLQSKGGSPRCGAVEMVPTRAAKQAFLPAVLRTRSRFDKAPAAWSLPWIWVTILRKALWKLSFIARHWQCGKVM